MKHFEFTDETMERCGVTLHRIHCIEEIRKLGIKVGNLGGWIEKEENLSGDAWVTGSAQVTGNARVFGLGLETTTPDAPSLGNMKIGLKAAARCMRKSEAFIREGLIKGQFPFGTAIQGTGCRVNPYINPEKFRDYVGAERFDQFFNTVA